MAEFNPPSSPDTGSDTKDVPPDSDTEDVAPSDHRENKPSRRIVPAGGKDHARREPEPEKAKGKSGHKFDKEKIVAKMMSLMEEIFNMDEETRREWFPLPSMPRPTPATPEVTFRALRELNDEKDEKDEDKVKGAAPAGNQSHGKYSAKRE